MEKINFSVDKLHYLGNVNSPGMTISNRPCCLFRSTDNWVDDTLGNQLSSSRGIDPVIVHKDVYIYICFFAHGGCGITIIRYTLSQMIVKTNNLKIFRRK